LHSQVVKETDTDDEEDDKEQERAVVSVPDYSHQLDLVMGKRYTPQFQIHGQ
jgi:hypothetical protein